MIKKGEYIKDYKKRVMKGECTGAENYVVRLPDFDEKACGDFEIEDMEKAYNAGYTEGCKALDWKKDTIINFLKKELQKKTYCRQVMKRQYRELKQKYNALLAKESK